MVPQPNGGRRRAVQPELFLDHHIFDIQPIDLTILDRFLDRPDAIVAVDSPAAADCLAATRVRNKNPPNVGDSVAVIGPY